MTEAIKTRPILTQQHGLLVLNKPKGPTSVHCLEMIKRRCKQKKIGHAGTLDPLAEGVLLVLLGQGTKIAQYLVEGGKTYSGALRLGTATDTYDTEGAVTAERDASHITEKQVLEAVKEWEACDTQIVPPYSAAKHKGTPLYKLSREGKEPPLKTKPVTINRAEVLAMDLPLVRFRVQCGAGTYIRSLVHSLGMRLECGAVMTQLTREHSHPFGLDQAHSLNVLLDEPESLKDKVLPLEHALPHWPTLTLSRSDAELVRNGTQLPFVPAGSDVEDAARERRALFLSPEGRALALVELRIKGGIPVWAILRGLWQS